MDWQLKNGDFLNTKKSKHKETRWNRIRKKHLNNLTVTTSTVKKFINMNFIDENEIRLMSSDEKKPPLNPVVVMNVRHEMIRNKPKSKDATPTKDILKAIKDEAATARKELREKTLIENELAKFRQQLSTRPKSQQNGVKKNHLFINMPASEDFVEVDDFDEKNFFSRFYAEIIEGGSPSDRSKPVTTPQTASPPQEISPKCNFPLASSSTSSSPSFGNRVVRFGEDVEVITYEKETSVSSLSSLSTSSDLYLEMADSDTESYGFRNLNLDCFEPELKNFRMVTSQYEDTNGFHYSQSTIEMTDNFLTITKYENCKKCEDINYFGEHVFDEDRDRFAEIIEIEPPEAPLPSREEIPESELMLIRRMEPESKDFSDLFVSNGYRLEEKDKIIDELFTEQPTGEVSDEVTLKNYFQKWRERIQISKITRETSVSKKDRVRKIHEFLNRVNIHKRNFLNDAFNKALQNTKTLDSTHLKKNYEHKLKIQQDIIELQKLKLNRQERMITELKLSKLSDEARAAKLEVKNELENLVKTGDVKLRAKAKSIRLVGNIKVSEEEDEMQRLKAQGMTIPKFLAKMQQRAMERTMKHQEAKERRLRLEQEKEDTRFAAEEAKRLLDEEAKRRRIEELREKRRHEKIDKIQREKDRILFVEGMKRAKEFYIKYMLRRVMRRFKAALERMRLNEIKADLCYKKQLVRMCFIRWSCYTIELWQDRNERATNSYNKLACRLAFRLWKDHFLLQQSKMLVAIDWYELQLSSRIIKQWNERAKELKEIEAIKILRAVAHHNWQLKWKVLVHWQRLPAINKIEKETEERRQKWRLKIMELCPDYNPRKDCD